MTRQFKVVAQTQTGRPQVIQFTLEDTALQQLQSFVHFARDLSASEIIRTGDWGSVRFQWQEGTLHEEARIPAEQLIESLLMRFRPFILQSEPTHLPKITNEILAKRIHNERMRALLGSFRDVFSGRDQRTNMMDIMVEHNGKARSLFSNDLFDSWTNAFYFHKNREKQQHLREMSAPLSLDHAVFHWLWFLEEKCRAILALANLIDFLLNNSDKSKALKVGPRKSELTARPPSLPPPEEHPRRAGR